MAERLDISPSYLNLLERNLRPVSARLMLTLAERFDVDPRDLTGDEPGGGLGPMRRRMADPIFADLGVEPGEIEDWLAASPGTAAAFARLYDRVQGGAGSAAPGGAVDDPVARVRGEIERWRNHFADLDHAAEELADALRLQSGDLYSAIAERLRTKHQLSIRILPESVMPEKLRRLDLHARQLQLSEMLDMASRTFQAAYLLGQLEFRSDINALVAGAQFGDRTAERLYQRHIFSYFAAAVMMPYGRFLRACEQSGYDMLLLQRRFGAGFEHVAHRLTTLQRVGQRGSGVDALRRRRAGAARRYRGNLSLVAPAPGVFAPQPGPGPAGRAGGCEPLAHARAQRAGRGLWCGRHDGGIRDRPWRAGRSGRHALLCARHGPERGGGNPDRSGLRDVQARRLSAAIQAAAGHPAEIRRSRTRCHAVRFRHRLAAAGFWNPWRAWPHTPQNNRLGEMP
jgi:transcriptional regulator with XRE-family HTH domain